ncbi:hypothetical protein B7P43_G17800 [Cryptotermes secundus]|uniref:Coiled-coil SMC6 And NSE5 INteracting (CANIN) domain-containing protein n=1 Tax=Cryptotermes secundus TaxID=105785 RepID=A0A2J7R6D9_9NEOP|nr:hypothetical protein B7P43_G17800 [Cryptotermes secundus]
MSDSEEFYEFAALKLTKSICSEEKKIVLDPAVTLAQRQKDAELDIKIAELTKDTESLSFKHVSSGDSSIEAFVQKLHQPSVQEIKSSHPCRTTFVPKEFSCLFSQDSLNIKDFQLPHGPFTQTLHQMSGPELHECICRYELKLPSLSDEVLHPLCQFLFLLMSVHRDERTVHACAVTLYCIKGDWYPSFDIILIIFINWGISSEFLDVYSIGKNGNFPLKLTKKLVSNLRVPDNNVEKVLEFIHSVAPSLSKNGPEDKFNKLMQVLVLSALDEGFRSPVLQSCYSRCIGVLLNAIPESQWNENRVWALCQMLHRDGTEHFHNQAVVCCSLLTLSPHAIEIAKALAFATLNHLLATELKTKPLDSIANTSIFALLKYYEPVNELNCYVLYIIIMLVDFCLSRAYVEDNLNLVIRSHVFSLYCRILSSHNSS